MDAERQYAPPSFDPIVLTALDELRKARRSLVECRRKLLTQGLTPVRRGQLEKEHDRAAQRVTSSVFWLNDALDQVDALR